MFYGPDDGSNQWAGETIEEITVCAWVKSSSNEIQFIASFDRSEYWRLALRNVVDGVNTGKVGWDLTDTTGTTHLNETDRDYADGQWHFVCATYSTTEESCNIYIDGQKASSSTFSGPIGTGAKRYGFIGAGSEATAFGKAGNIPGLRAFRGDIDDVMIFDEALAESQIQQLYNFKMN